MDEFYRIPFSSGEAWATLAVLKAVARLTAPAEGTFVDTDIEPGILLLAAERMAGELPEFVADNADRLAHAIEAAFRAHWRRLESEAGGHDEENTGDPTEPPFPTVRTRRLLEDAMEQRSPVEIEYYVRSRNDWTTRRVDISGIFSDKGVWKLSGQCGLRNEFRQFRLDHIRGVRVLDDEDELPDPFEEE